MCQLPVTVHRRWSASAYLTHRRHREFDALMGCIAAECPRAIVMSAVRARLLVGESSLRPPWTDRSRPDEAIRRP